MKLPRIIDVEDAMFTAVAYEEDGEIVVEVSDQLEGRERAAAIMAAVRAHQQGLGSIVLLPVALYLWEPVKAATQKHPATALASTAVIVAIAAAAVAGTTLRNPGNDTLIAAPPAHTVVATITAAPRVEATTRSLSPRATPAATRGRPSRTPGRPRVKPTPRPASSRETQPASSPAASRRPTVRTSPTAHTAASPRATPRPSAVDTPSAVGLGADIAPPLERSTASPPASVRGLDPTPSETEPADMAASAPGCFVEIDLDPLLGLCLR